MPCRSDDGGNPHACGRDCCSTYQQAHALNQSLAKLAHASIFYSASLQRRVSTVLFVELGTIANLADKYNTHVADV